MDTEGVEKGCGVADIERDDEVGEKGNTDANKHVRSLREVA